MAVHVNTSCSCGTDLHCVQAALTVDMDQTGSLLPAKCASVSSGKTTQDADNTVPPSLEHPTFGPCHLPASGQALVHSDISHQQGVLQTCCASCLQVALIVVMAQIGSFVPARYATIRLVDKVFTRIGTQDSIEDNSSSFLVRAVAARVVCSSCLGHTCCSSQSWAGLCADGSCSLLL